MTLIPTISGQGQENQKFKVMLRDLGNLRPALANRRPFLKQQTKASEAKVIRGAILSTQPKNTAHPGTTQRGTMQEAKA